MTDIRNKLVLEVDAKGAQGAAKSLGRVADAVEDIHDNMPPDDLFDDADFDRMAASAEDAADAARDYAEAVDDGARATREVAKATQGAGKAAKELTAEEKRQLAIEQAREKALHDLTALQDEQTRNARQAAALLQRRNALATELASLTDASAESDRRRLAIAKELERQADAEALNADEAVQLGRQVAELEERRRRNNVELLSLSDRDQQQQRAAIAAAKTREQLEQQRAALLDVTTADQREEVHLLREAERLNNELAAQSDRYLGIHRQDLALQRQGEALKVQEASLANEAQRASRTRIQAEQQRIALAVQLEGLSDAEQRAMRDRLAAARQLEQLEQQRAQGGNLAIMQAHQQVALDQQRRQLAVDLLSSQDASIQGARKQKWVRDQVFRLEQELADINNPQIQGMRAQLEMEKLKLKLVDEILEIEQGRGGAISDANQLLQSETSELREKLKLLEQEKAIHNDIRELSRTAGTVGDLRNARNDQVRLENMRDLNDETVRLQQMAGDKTILRQMRAQEVLRERIRLSTRTWRDYVSQYAEVLEKTDSSIQVWFTIGMVIERAFQGFLSGAITNAIQDANERLGEVASTAEILAGAGGTLTKRQAGSASLRAAELGVSAQGRKLAQFASGLGGRSVLLGESEDIGQATVTALQQLQEEFAKGELGQAFQDLGTSQARFNDAVRRAAAERGVLPEALDLQTRQQLLLAQATNDSTLALSLYGAEQVKGAAQLKSFVFEARDAIFGALAEGDLHRILVASLERDISFAQQAADEQAAFKARVGGRKIAEMEESGGYEDTEFQLRQRQAEAEKQLAATVETERLARTRAVTQELVKQMDTLLLLSDRGGEELLLLGQILEMERSATGSVMDRVKAQAALLAKSELISADMLIQMRSKIGLQGIDQVLAELQARQLQATIKANEAKAAGNKLRLEGAKFAALEEGKDRFSAGLELARNQARLEFEQAFLKYQEQTGATAQEAADRMKDERVQALLRLETEQATLAEKRKFGVLFTEHQQKQKEANAEVLAMKEQILAASDNMEMFNRTLGRAVAVQAFKKISDDGQLLLEKLVGGKDQLDEMVMSAGRLAGALNNLSGGKLFGDNFLNRLFMKDDEKDKTSGGGGKKDKTGSGGSKKEDDLLERLRREKIARDIAAAEYSAAKQQEVVMTHLDNMRAIFSPSAESPLALDYLFGANFDAELALKAQELEWWYRDTMKQAGDRAKERAAVELAFEEKKALLMREASRRQYAEMMRDLDAAVAQGFGVIKSAAARAAAGWDEVERRHAHMTQAVAAARARIMDEARFDSASGYLTLMGDRDLTETELNLHKQRESLEAERDYELGAYEWTAAQKYAIELDYQQRIFELEQEHNRARLEENNRLREANLAIAEQGLAEVKELMSAFSDEARSMSEGSQATFQGGISQFGKDMVEGFGAAQVGMMGLVATMGEVDEALVKMKEKDANAVGVWAGALAGAGAASLKYTDGIIKDERKKAAIKGAIHAASAIGEYATGNVVGGTMHALAAAQFFAIAGTATKAPEKAKKAEATKKTALSATTVALSRDRGPTAITNVFVSLEPISGRAMVSELNNTARTTRGTSIDARLMRPTATVRTDL